MLCVEQFKPITHEMPSMRQVHIAKNLFEAPEIRTMIESARHNFIVKLIDNTFSSVMELDTALGLGATEIPSLKSLFKKEEEGKEVAGS